MNIIFGTKEAEQLKEKYIVLELDTITIRNSDPIVAYCIVDTMPIDNLSKTEPFIKLHSDLMENYRKKDWNYCEQAIEQLRGFWGADTDTFYDSLLARIKEYQQNEPDDSWTGIVARN